MTATEVAPPSSGRIAVLLMAYGTPRHRDEVLAYYTDIRRGRPPTPEQLHDLINRYEAIGGISPLAQRTESQRNALQLALDSLAPDRYLVALGLKHASPTIETAVHDLARLGFDRIVGLVLAPHFSSFSIGQYHDRLRNEAATHGIETTSIDSWATEPAFVEFLARDLILRLAAMPLNTRVLFTAHSLPQRIIDAGDPYPQELLATAQAVATRVGLDSAHQWGIAWQSAGRTHEPWIGPDILQVIDELGRDEHVSGVVVSACGFVADHLEVLYDLDIEAKTRAAALGLAFDRTACVNDDAAVMSALASCVAETANAAGW